MKIAFDHQIFTHQNYGGISRYFYFLAKELSNHGQDIKIFTGFHQNSYIGGLSGNIVNGIKIKYPNSSIKWKFKNFIYLFNNYICQKKMKLWKPDIIHETYYSSSLPSTRGSIRVTTVYDMVHELFKESFGKDDLTPITKKKTLDRVDHIFSISHNTKNDLMELLEVRESKISVVHLGVDLNIFKKPKNEKLNLPKPYILYVGSRSGYKNFNRFLKACSNSIILKNKIKILVFGGEYFDGNELSNINKLGFSDGNVEHVTGDDNKLAKLYANALCLVYPSLYEGFGLPPLEAMASGCPVVASNTSSMPEIINDAGEFFNPYDIEEIQYAIESLILSNTRREQLISLGYKNIKRFSWSKCAEESLNIYKNLTGNS